MTRFTYTTDGSLLLGKYETCLSGSCGFAHFLIVLSVRSRLARLWVCNKTRTTEASLFFTLDGNKVFPPLLFFLRSYLPCDRSGGVCRRPHVLNMLQRPDQNMLLEEARCVAASCFHCPEWALCAAGALRESLWGVLSRELDCIWEEFDSRADNNINGQCWGEEWREWPLAGWDMAPTAVGVVSFKTHPPPQGSHLPNWKLGSTLKSKHFNGITND